MKPGLALVLLLALTACSHSTKIYTLDVEDPPRAKSPLAEERKAADQIRDIEDRIKSGDLPKIEFESDKDAIAPESDETLDLIVRVLLSSDHLKLIIQAHTDSRGKESYNLALSRRRAKSVLQYFVDKGIPPPSMRFRGYGSSRPIADNATEAGRAKNRRVELYIATRDWNAVY